MFGQMPGHSTLCQERNLCFGTIFLIAALPLVTFFTCCLFNVADFCYGETAHSSLGDLKSEGMDLMF